MGNNTKWINIQQIIIVGANVAIGFSLLGGISFVGIIAANIAMFISKKTRWSGILSGFSAAFITALAYLLMNGFVNLYYPIGITTSLITIPYFIFKIVRGKNG